MAVRTFREATYRRNTIIISEDPAYKGIDSVWNQGYLDSRLDDGVMVVDIGHLIEVRG